MAATQATTSLAVWKPKATMAMARKAVICKALNRKALTSSSKRSTSPESPPVTTKKKSKKIMREC